MTINPYYQKNPILKDSTVNVTFDELLSMSSEEFDAWVLHARKEILKAWDNYGCPPRSGKNQDEMISEFNKLSSINVSSFQKTDELGGDPNTVVYNTIHAGTEVDQFFSNMMKVPMNYSSKNIGYSVYDLFSKDEHKERMIKRSRRHFRRDSFYHYSLCIKTNDKDNILPSSTGKEWIIKYWNDDKIQQEYDFWLQEAEPSKDISTGYYQVKQSDFLYLTAKDIEELDGCGCGPCPFVNHQISNTSMITDQMYIDKGHLNPDPNKIYLIRLYKKNQKVFPKAFTAFRIGYISVPINFPPLTAKFLYEKYTEHLKDQEKIIIYDPSSGWGGRILGAMSCSPDRKIHYVGTDPNPDNIHSDGKTKYEHIVEFFNSNTYRGYSIFDTTNTYDIFTEGSEEIHKHPRFQQYKGKVDLIFTSPPYFNRELYSTDSKQAAVKFANSYESWRDGFLYPTLKTCYEWLKPGGYILWNIADVLTENGYLPLEKDSIEILKQLGMKQEPTQKMVLASMPGAQRLDENGIPKCKNYCKVNGRYMKYEPIFVFRKI